LKHNSKAILLATLIICLIVAIVLAGCGGYSASYVAGVYRGPSSPLMPSGPGQILQLDANGNYDHTTYIPNPQSKTAPPGSVTPPLAPARYEGTFTVKGNLVVLHGEPPEAYGTFKIAGINLWNHWGTWLSGGEQERSFP
jgi:hypothetical protein